MRSVLISLSLLVALILLAVPVLEGRNNPFIWIDVIIWSMWFWPANIFLLVLWVAPIGVAVFFCWGKHGRLTTPLILIAILDALLVSAALPAAAAAQSGNALVDVLVWTVWFWPPDAIIVALLVGLIVAAMVMCRRRRALMIALIAVAVAIFPYSASAQRKPTPRPAPQATPTICDPLDFLHLAPGCKAAPSKPTIPDNAMSGINAELQRVTKQVVDTAVADVTAALTDAKNRNDVISLPCWQANLDFLELLPIEWKTPPEMVGPALAFQIGRDLIAALTGSDAKSMKVACAAMWGDTASIATNALALIGIKALIPGI